MYPRFLTQLIKKRLKFFPVLLLVGPRQSGKTTLAKQLAKELGMSYLSFDDITSLIAMQLDPANYLRSLQKPLILDEVQRAPEIFLPIKFEVDHDRKPGSYLLTGSANPLVAPKLGDSLVGRMTVLHMWPLSQGELSEITENFVDRLFEKNLEAKEFAQIGYPELIRRVFLGGFPTMHSTTEEENQRAWCNDYLSLTLQKDLQDLSKIEGFAHLPALLYGLAARVGSTLNLEELSRLARASSTSVKRYIQLLENLFLIYRLPAWSTNIDKKLVKAPKMHFADTALLMHVLNMTKEQLQANLSLLGHVVENFVVMECVKQSSWSELNLKLYHYRQQTGEKREVDLVIESPGSVVGIEIKLSSVIRSDDTKGLQALKEASKDLFHRGIVFYMGNKVLPIGEKLYAVPISSLWSNWK